MQTRRVGGERASAGRDRIERRIIDFDQGSEVFRDITIGRNHQRDRLADMADPVGGKEFRQYLADAGMPARNEQRLVDEGQVLRGQHRERASVKRRPPVYAADFRMGMRAADKHRMNHPVEMDVVHKASLAGEQPTVFDAQQGLLGLGCGHASNSLMQSPRQTAASLRR